MLIAHGERLLSLFSGGNEGRGCVGQGAGFGAAAVPGKALGVTHCGSSYCLFLWVNHFFLAVSRFRLMKGLWSCVFMLSNVLIGDKLSKSIVLIKGKTHSHVESAEAKLPPFSYFKHLYKWF